MTGPADMLPETAEWTRGELRALADRLAAKMRAERMHSVSDQHGNPMPEKLARLLSYCAAHRMLTRAAGGNWNGAALHGFENIKAARKK